ncbi:helix-turn-helix domain-containing protein [Gracilimonas tropica]|uniref:helix-turn-helix domain-containing protein n=1 Tax=Gracilimonas tropica TaxID=454600 RepID=UPI0003755C6A|nr:helix-turn-helix domain-containing protein [Gracilimonas tropica]
MNNGKYVIFIKNMVCPQCILVVRQSLLQLGCTVQAVELGHAVINKPQDAILQQITERLKEVGFDLLISEEARTVEKVKILLIRLLYFNTTIKWVDSYSEYLELFMQVEYEKLDKQFLSECECSIHEYFNTLRFERAKELISYKTLSVRCIVEELGYGSYEELSLDFEQRLKMDIKSYSDLDYNYRVSLDKIIYG